jgi:hypothetical protein
VRADSWLSPANQCRQLGIRVGDMIQSKDSSRPDVRLRLIWIGDDETVWRQWSRIPGEEWGIPFETTHWNLGFREWEKIATE